MNRLPLLMLLGQLVFYLGLWLLWPNVAALVGFFSGLIALVILAIALLAEWAERTRVPKTYFWMMVVTVLAPLILFGALYLLGLHETFKLPMRSLF